MIELEGGRADLIGNAIKTNTVLLESAVQCRGVVLQLYSVVVEQDYSGAGDKYITAWSEYLVCTLLCTTVSCV